MNTIGIEAASFKEIGIAMRALDLAAIQQETSVLAPNGKERFARVFQLYNGVRPLLSVVATLRLIPATWRVAVSLFIDALDAAQRATTNNPNPDPADFKAGKDL